jgi:serine/threonine protein kinase
MSQNRAKDKKQEIPQYLPKNINIRDYELRQTIGKGSLSIIKLSKATQSNKFFAVKKIKKSSLISLNLKDRIYNEILSLSLCENNYIQKYQGFAMDDKYIYILTELLTGGGLYPLLRSEGRFPLAQAKIYSAEIVLILEYLHSKNIIYRDLRPENLLFDHKGFLRLIDFGLAKVCEGQTYTVCGLPEYLAPEILLNKGYGKEIDWWAFGCFVYELLVGISPFYEKDPIVIFKRILKRDIKFPSNFPASAKSLIKHCLEKDIGNRYGGLIRGINEIKEHRFFKDIGWNSLNKQKGKQIYTPNLENADDMKSLNMINYDDEESNGINPEEDPFTDWIKKKDQ